VVLLWPEDQKYPNPLKTLATTPLVVSEEGIMAKKSKITPHYFLSIWPETPVQRNLADWTRPPIWKAPTSEAVRPI
jgi:hypothetical protein